MIPDLIHPDGHRRSHDYIGDYPGVAQAIDEAIARGEFVDGRTAGLGWAGKVS